MQISENALLFASWNSGAVAGWWVLENGFVLLLTGRVYLWPQDRAMYLAPWGLVLKKQDPHSLDTRD